MSKEFIMQLESTIKNLRRDNQLLKEELLKYKAIENSNHSEALECLERIDNTLCLNNNKGKLEFGIDTEEHIDCDSAIGMVEDLETIKQALLKSQANARSEEILQKYYQDGITLDSVRALKEENAELRQKAQRLESIDNTESSEALKSLEFICKILNEKRIDVKWLFKHDYNIIIQALQRLKSIENANLSKALECLEELRSNLGVIYNNILDNIEQALLKAQEQELHNGVRLPNKEILYLKQSLEQYNDTPIFYISRTYGNKYIVPQKQLDDLVKEKELLEATIEDLRKEINLPKEQETKKYLKWEDLVFKEEEQTIEVLLNGEKYSLSVCSIHLPEMYVVLGNSNFEIIITKKQFFNDLHLEMVKE